MLPDPREGGIFIVITGPPRRLARRVPMIPLLGQGRARGKGDRRDKPGDDD